MGGVREQSGLTGMDWAVRSSMMTRLRSSCAC